MKQMLVASMLLCMAFFPAVVGHEDTGDDWVAISRPVNGLFLFDLRVLPLAGQIVLGPVTVTAEASPSIDRVVFLVPPKVGCRPWEVGNVTEEPYSFLWQGSNGAIQDTGLATLIAWGFNGTVKVAEDTILLLRFAA
ncbi:MAG: Ig-like domain-containing protein [Thermoplasmatota archaeon]